MSETTEGKIMVYQFKLDTWYDGEMHSTETYTNALDAVGAYSRCTDWGFADKFATYNLSEPNGKMHTKNYWRNGETSGK